MLSYVSSLLSDVARGGSETSSSSSVGMLPAALEELTRSCLNDTFRVDCGSWDEALPASLR